MRDYSVPVGLDARVLVDLVVVGSVAVSEKGKIKNRNPSAATWPAACFPAALLGFWAPTARNFSFWSHAWLPKPVHLSFIVKS